MKNIDNIEELLKAVPLIGYGETCEYVLMFAPDGLFLEFGVAGGDSLRKIAEMSPKVQWHGFDSFEGLPEAWNGNQQGQFRCSPPTMPINVKLHIGMFEATLPNFVAENRENVGYINVDCDLYSSTKSIFRYLGNQIVPGTLLRFDELTGFPTWLDHEYKALKEFLDDRNYDVEFLFKENHERSLARVIDVR